MIGPKEPARVLELALPPGASSDYSLDLGCSQYRASGPSLPRDGLSLQRPVLRLAQAGTSQEDAYLYAEGVRRGGTLVSARVADADRARYEAVLDRSAVNVRDRGAAWRKAGWQNFDPKAAPYTAEQIRRERELYRSSGGTR
jgi:hypothetical protein